ncbi:MAG: hypothetical protein EP344_19880 [Bacteroidetes bacterium]|nr:MAG: hypothetical protein EP344_19880 [Bacteroidota bacterium]
MKKQDFNFKTQILLSVMTVLFFGFYMSGAMATAPVSLLKGELPVPGSNVTADFLPTSLHGVLLENQGVKLVWQEDGDLALTFYDKETLWSSNTSGTGAVLYFMQNDGKLLIKDNNNNTIWSAGTSGGSKLWLQSNRNLVLQNSSNQTVWNTDTAMPPLGTDGVQRIEAVGDFEEFMVPYTNYQYMTIRTEGADGGMRDVKEAWGATRFKVKAGAGATIIGTYEIGTGDDQIPPGSFLRVVVGKKGDTRTGQTTAGCRGGGGTGVFVRRYDDPEWRLLQVAGGGGGAYSDCCTVKKEGRSAETGRDGGDGGGTSQYIDGGTNGGDGDVGGGLGLHDGYGGGVFEDDWGNPNPWPGGDSDPTILPMAEGFSESSGYKFGCARGGNQGTAGGGGGGYSGGGAGDPYFAGGGGGSYVNTEQMAVHNIVKVKNDRTTNTQDGYIEIEFSNVLPDGMIHFAYNTGKCVDVTGSNTSNGTNILSYTCHGTTNQKWYINTVDRTIRTQLNTGKCLDLTGGSISNGTNIQLWDCAVNDNQRWVYNGLYKTIHSARNAYKCIDAANGSAGGNVNIQLWDCQYTQPNQKWEIYGATTVSDVANKKHIVSVLAPGFAVHSHTGAESGSNIQLWTKDNIDTREQWYFDGLAIKMRDHQNLCIDLKSSSTSNGNNIQLYNCNGTNAQQWLYDGMTQSIRSVINQGKCMQIVKNTDGVYGKRSNVEIHDCNGSAEQQFLIQE